jgi:DNA-binding MarR family transcriptional regulator
MTEEEILFCLERLVAIIISRYLDGITDWNFRFWNESYSFNDEAVFDEAVKRLKEGSFKDGKYRYYIEDKNGVSFLRVEKLDLDSRIERLTEGSSTDDVKGIIKELLDFDPYDQGERIDKIAEKIKKPSRRLERLLRFYEEQREKGDTDSDAQKELILIGLPTNERFLEIIHDAVSLGFSESSDEFRVKEIKVTGKITGEDENIEFFDTIAHSSYSPKTKRTGNLGCVVGSSSGSGKNYVTDEVLESYPNYKHISRITPAAVDRNFVNTNLDYTIFDFAEEKSLFSYNKNDSQQSSMIRQLLTEGELDLETLDENLNPKCLTTKGRPCFFLKTTIEIGDEQWHRRVCPKSLDETNLQTAKITSDTMSDFFGKIRLKEREPTFTKKYNEFIYVIQTGKALKWFNEDEEFKLKVLSKFNESFESIDENTVKTILTPVSFVTIPLYYKKIIEEEILKFLFEDKFNDEQLDKLFELFDIDTEEEEEVFREKFEKLDEGIKKVLEDIDPDRLIFRTFTPRLITFIQISALKNRFKRTHLVHDGGISLLADSYDVIKSFKFMFPYLKGYSFGKLRPSETKILKSLSDSIGEKLVSDISEDVDIARPTVNRDVASLFYKGLANRTGTKTQGYKYTINEKGKKVLELFKLKKKGNEFISAYIINEEFLSRLKEILENSSGRLYVNMGEEENKITEIKLKDLKIVSTLPSYKRINGKKSSETLDNGKNETNGLIILTDVNQVEKSKEKEEFKEDSKNDANTTKKNTENLSESMATKLKAAISTIANLWIIYGEKFLKSELKRIPQEIVKKFYENGSLADLGNYVLIARPEDFNIVVGQTNPDDEEKPAVHSNENSNHSNEKKPVAGIRDETEEERKNWERV